MAFVRRYHNRWQVLANNGRTVGWFASDEEAHAVAESLPPEEENEIRSGDIVLVKLGDLPVECVVREPLDQAGRIWSYETSARETRGLSALTAGSVTTFVGRET